jgi:membrane associated rhomboid family serine protease
VVTTALIIVNVLIFFRELSLGDELEVFVYRFAVIPARALDLWAEGAVIQSAKPFLTAMFLHAGWWHLIGNMLYLWIFGDNVEDKMGHVGFLVFYLMCGMGSSLAHTLSEPSSIIPSLGASGAIAGVLGAYIILFPRSRVVTLVPIFFFIHFVEIPAFVFLGIWFLMQLMSGLAWSGAQSTGGGIAWWAHIGGFAIGAVLMPFFRRRSRNKKPG